MTRKQNENNHNVNLWLVPLKMSLAAILLFAVTVTVDLLAAYHHLQLPGWFTMGGIDDARAILGAMLGCVSTVLALIFSVTLLVLSMVANLFGPRLLYRFVQDWVTQACIGLFMGAFIYVFLVFLVTHQDQNGSFIPQASLITSWFVVLGAFGFLVFYSHRVAVLIQNPDAIGRIVDDIRVVVEEQRTSPLTPQTEARDQQRLSRHEEDCRPVFSKSSGYVQWVSHAQLVKAAAARNALITLPARPGQFLLEGEPVAFVSPASAADGLASTIARSIRVGRHRVLAQDIEFGLAQIVEIAIRALSPAINDTFTGVACVDFLGEALVILVGGSAFTGRLRDRDDVLRVQMRPLLTPRLIKQAFDQIRQAATDNPAVLIRLLSTIGRLSFKMQDLSDIRALREQAAAVWETAITRSPVEMDRFDIETAWRLAETRLTDAERVMLPLTGHVAI